MTILCILCNLSIRVRFCGGDVYDGPTIGFSTHGLLEALAGDDRATQVPRLCAESAGAGQFAGRRVGHFGQGLPALPEHLRADLSAWPL